VTDGRSRKTREQLAATFIEAKHLDEAIAVAAKIPHGPQGHCRVRPVIEMPNLP
jgi:hypothetical protein